MSTTNTNNTKNPKLDKKTIAINRAENTIVLFSILDIITSISFLIVLWVLNNPDEEWFLLQIPHVASGIVGLVLVLPRERYFYIFGSVFFAIVLFLDVLGVFIRGSILYDCIFKEESPKCTNYLFSNFLTFGILLLFILYDAVRMFMSIRLTVSLEEHLNSSKTKHT